MLAIGVVEIGILGDFRRLFPVLSGLSSNLLRFQDAGQERNGIVTTTDRYVDHLLVGRLFRVLAALVKFLDGLVLEEFFFLGILVDIVLVLLSFTVFLQYNFGLGGVFSELESDRQLGGTVPAQTLGQAIGLVDLKKYFVETSIGCGFPMWDHEDEHLQLCLCNYGTLPSRLFRYCQELCLQKRRWRFPSPAEPCTRGIRGRSSAGSRETSWLRTEINFKSSRSLFIAES